MKKYLYSSRDIVAIAVKAGQEALRLRSKGLDVKTKPDGSIVTNADYAADKIVTDGLRAIDPSALIISEEGDKQNPYGEYDTAWVVDPIDGTSAFRRGGKNFAVLIGRVENHVPTQGVAYYPEHNIVYYTNGDRAYKRSVNIVEDEIEYGTPLELKMHPVLSRPLRFQELRSTVLEKNKSKLPEGSKIHGYNHYGSIWAVLEGSLDIASYGKMGDWDFVAEDAILRKAGGIHVYASTGEPLEYGKHRTEEDAYLQEDNIAGNIETLVRYGLASPELKLGHTLG